MEGLVTGAFGDILKAERDTLNAKFVEAKLIRPNLDPDAFKEILVATVAPIVQAVDQCTPNATRQVAWALYDLSLDLLGQDFIGANSRYPSIMQGWKYLLPNIPRQISASPRAVIGSITNALYNLSQVPNARPQEWVTSMLTLAPFASDATTFLPAGQIAAWRAGLAHYRKGALELAKKIPPVMARAALGLSPTSETPTIETLVNRLAADPWLNPASIKDQPSGQRSLQVVARVGAFRGFGGLFRTPPTVANLGEHFVVKDDSTSWLLVADCFGATFHRVDGVQPTKMQSPFRIEKSGKVSCDRYTANFPELADYTSMAANATTLAVTSSLSFAVSLIALVES
ncbi:MAG: hypothetical protein HZB51_10830 [Chloroflexi bacterium]|nr:hypothetical protein [Chloroflexota bacterium]